MPDASEEDFIRRWSERVFDISQLAAMQSIREQLIDFALHGWRAMEIRPPEDELLICACEEGLVLMTINDLGAWRTSTLQPHKPPRAWMPAPVLPGTLGGDRA